MFGSFALGDTRIVKVGDIVEITMPADANTGATEWKIHSFDSALLALDQRPAIRATANGGVEWTVRFRAKVPGKTEVVLMRRGLVRSAGDDRRRYTISILNR